jgi:uncharacterized protein (TIGR03435 family)
MAGRKQDRWAILRGRLPLIAHVLSLAVGVLAFSPWVDPVRAAQAAAPAFEVASIKLSGSVELGRAQRLATMENSYPRGLFSAWGRTFETRGATATQLVAGAYLIPAREIVGPAWMSDIRFDIDAIIPAGQTPGRASEMLRGLLEERFSLKAHREVRRMSGYILSVGPGAVNLTDTGPPDPTKDFSKHVNRIKPGFNGQQMDHGDMAQLTNALSISLGAPVDDQTGLKGHYAILLQYLYSEWSDEAARPAILREALRGYGLRLSAGKIDVPVLVIDNMSKTPTAN